MMKDGSHLVRRTQLQYHNMLSFKLLSKLASKPMKRFCTDPGFELRSSENITIPAKSRSSVKTDLKITFPNGYFGLIVSLPENSLNKKIDVITTFVSNGADSINVILDNKNEEEFKLSIMDPIGFLIPNKYMNMMFIYQEN